MQYLEKPKRLIIQNREIICASGSGSQIKYTIHGGREFQSHNRRCFDSDPLLLVIWIISKKRNRSVFEHKERSVSPWRRLLEPQGSLNPDSTMESKPPIYCVLLMWQYIYERERERNQDSKFYLDSKSSRKSRMNVRETSVPYKLK